MVRPKPIVLQIYAKIINKYGSASSTLHHSADKVEAKLLKTKAKTFKHRNRERPTVVENKQIKTQTWINCDCNV